jgi:hypothetical protein
MNIKRKILKLSFYKLKEKPGLQARTKEKCEFAVFVPFFEFG